VLGEGRQVALPAARADRQETGGTLENDYERGRRDEAIDERKGRGDDTAAESASERGRGDAPTRY